MNRRRLRAGCLGNLRGVPSLLRGDASREGLVGALGVVDQVEPLDLVLELGVALRHGLLVQSSEQGLMEALVLALGSRLVRLAADRLDAE